MSIKVLSIDERIETNEIVMIKCTNFEFYDLTPSDIFNSKTLLRRAVLG